MLKNKFWTKRTTLEWFRNHWFSCFFQLKFSSVSRRGVYLILLDFHHFLVLLTSPSLYNPFTVVRLRPYFNLSSSHFEFAQPLLIESWARQHMFTNRKCVCVGECVCACVYVCVCVEAIHVEFCTYFQYTIRRFSHSKSHQIGTSFTMVMVNTNNTDIKACSDIKLSFLIINSLRSSDAIYLW